MKTETTSPSLENNSEQGSRRPRRRNAKEVKGTAELKKKIKRLNNKTKKISRVNGFHQRQERKNNLDPGQIQQPYSSE